MLGMLAGGLGTGMQAGLTGLQTVFGWLATAFRFVGGQLMGLGGLLLRFGALLGGIVVGGLTAFAAAVGASTKAAMEYSRSVIGLRNATGMGTGVAQGVAQRFGAFGFSPGDLANGGQYHGLTSMVGRAFGVNAFDPVSINARAQSFGGGLMGHVMRGSLLGSLGLNTPQGQWLANLPTAKVQAQAAFQQNAASGMGVTPETTRRLAEDLPLVINRFEILRDLLMNKIAAAALPYLESALTKAADFLSANGEVIANAIGTAVNYIANAFTQLGEFLMARGPQISEAIYNVVEWLYAEAPRLILGGLQTLIRAGMGFVEFFADLGHSLADQLRAFDQSKGALYSIVTSIASVFDATLNAFKWFGGGLAAAGAVIQNFAATNPALQAISLATGNGLIKMGGNPITAARDYFNANPDSNIAGMIPQLQNGTASSWADSLDAGASAMSATSNRYGSNAIASLQKIMDGLGSNDERRKELRAVVQELQKGNAIAEKVAANTDRTAQNMGTFRSDTINRVLSYIAEDFYLGVAGG